ncbi:MAG: sigma-54-dependent Fis family transcriptional regulator [Chromatiales bacterium]|nr:sigma-54-dependent Fis family transcriptional regulator [Chromatiales bacterium]
MNTSELAMIGKSAVLQRLVNTLDMVSATDVTVLLQGESGTGKELVAHRLHVAGPRADKPFVSINCAALPEGLVESELFGHVKGAFTGADGANCGRIAQADGGTLFLDEVGELPAAAQAKLLRFLENREVHPVGAGQARKVDVRIVAATNRDLAAQTREGGFRQDLFYRLNVVPLEIPPLRERHGDVALLVDHYLGLFAGRYGLVKPTVVPSALRRFTEYAWPGNVRELRNLCERLVVLLGGRVIDEDNLPAEIRETAQELSQAFQLPAGGISLAELEADLLRQALHRAGGNQSRAARLLNLTRDTFLYRLRKYSISA